MYKEDEIAGFISQVIEIDKEHENVLKNLKKDENKTPPNYNPIYLKSIEMAEEMCSHMDGRFPYKLFRSKAPNENPEEFEYRKLSFQPVTMPFMDRGMTTVNRIWNESNYTISDWDEYGVPEEEQPKEYFGAKYPKYKSLMSYFKSIVTNYKIKDPNALRVVKPRRIPTKVDGDGNLTVDQSGLLEPISKIYPCEQVIFFEEDLHALIELKEKSIVTIAGRPLREGRMFEFYDTKNIWKVTQVGEKNDNTFTFEVYYEHNLGKLPARRLMGKPSEDEEDYVLYKSHFMPAIPNLNIALYNSNTLEMSITNDAFPQRWEYVDPCSYEGCESGLIMLDRELHKTMNCPKCKGSGFTERHSPLGVKQVYVGDRLTQGAEGLSMPPAGYVSPDMTTLEFRHNKYLKDIEQAFAFLNIDVSNSKVQPSEGSPALSKKIDREELFSFLLLISNELFDLLEETIELIGKMRYGNQFKVPVITRPVDFSIRSNDELIQEIVEAKAALVPDIIIQKQLKEYCMSRFNTEKDVTKFLDIVFKIDRLITLTQQDIVLQKNIGTVLTWEVILHTSIYTFLEQSIIEDEKFLDQEFKVQQELLEKKAKDKEAEIKAASPAPTMDKILNIANANPQGNNRAKDQAA